MKNWLFLLLSFLGSLPSVAQQTYLGMPINYQEENVGSYTLLAVLKADSRHPVKTAKDWERYGRPATMNLFSQWVYGKTPQTTVPMRFEVRNQNPNALNGKARRKEIVVHFGQSSKHRMTILMYLPKAAKPVPVFLSLNYFGNQAVYPDPEITITDQWVRNDTAVGTKDNRATAVTRGKHARRFPVDTILARGYGLATIYYGDLDPDNNQGFQNGIHPLFYKKGQTEPDSSEWGTIGAWAWGLMRAMDYLEQDQEVDAKRVAVIGHSRQGKTALWAGAQDPRFALVIANDSGEGGAAICRRNFGETFEHALTSNAFWYCKNMMLFKKDIARLPVDFHQLLACIAPRPLYIASASKDLLADPKGEYLSAYHASEVYRLYGLKGLDSNKPPAVEQPITGRHIGYHLRNGIHDILLYDWLQFIAFADFHFYGKGR
ncbi:acetylxylan esterase [Fibrisoma montanum]|uniref:Acetylxylan esterase n=1 Tax=Fibrisoma montanum TaxID=2305895 RepID=A0A418M2P2_9BACT|nr:acetylxylan esterase [Fibrisoma montanum]RIV20011.1 acetylxylan esterase [Fibrisoma montanum]